MNTQERIQSWLDGPFDSNTKNELRHLQERDPKSLEDAFFKDLSFGTGGMRAVMGIGTNRLNIYTIRMATQGLANYIKQLPEENHSVFIGYDVRHRSREFAEETAKVLAGNGIKALLSKDICPTPLTSFACRYFKCTAAIMITASHNPPQYNGYKVYWADGAQIVPPHDHGIMAEVKKIKSLDEVLLKDDYEEIGSEIDTAYLLELKKLQLLPEMAEVALKIIYSNLHGTGIRLIPKALHTFGFTNVHFVEKQLPLDPEFTHAPTPNPEEYKALSLGMEQMDKENADLLIATDPDADRIGLAIRNTRFSGNQIACLLLNHICKTLKEKGHLPENGAVIKSIVTTELFKKIAESYGVKCVEVLTGFKYIGKEIGIWENAFDGYQYLFGAEESYGYLFGTFVRDKDAISTACLIAEMAASAKRDGKTLQDVLNEIYEEHGIYSELLINLAFQDTPEGMAKMQNLMHNLRRSPPKEIEGKKVVLVEDFLFTPRNLPPSDVLMFWLEDQTKLVIRPSGTEPKVKIYAETVGLKGESQEIVKQRLKQCTSSFEKNLH